MKELLFGVILALCFLGPATAGDKSEHGVYRPTLMTNPKSYLKKFALGEATTDEVIQYLGTPDKTMSLAGSDYLTYSIAPKTSTGVIEYTFEIKDGKVVNVTYLNSGNFFGVTQRESAKVLQAP